MTVYIPCYFNNIKERETNFYKNISQYLKLNYNIVIYWMNENDFDFIDSRIKIIKAEKANASIARNFLLKQFYNTNDDYAIFSDDDTYLNNYIIPEDKDCISYVNDFYSRKIETEKISSGFLLIINFKKKYNLQLFFDENLNANQDLDFGISLNKKGIKTYRYSTNDVIIYKGISSMFLNNMNKLNKKQKALNYINNKYGKYN